MDLTSNATIRHAGEGQAVKMQDSADLFEKMKRFEIRVLEKNNSTRLRRILVRRFYIRSGKVHPSAHIRIGAYGCEAVAEPKDK